MGGTTIVDLTELLLTYQFASLVYFQVIALASVGFGLSNQFFGMSFMLVGEIRKVREEFCCTVKLGNACHKKFEFPLNFFYKKIIRVGVQESVPKVVAGIFAFQICSTNFSCFKQAW